MSIVYKITNILSIFCFFSVRRYRIEDINVTHIEDINVSGKFYIVEVVLTFFMSQLSCSNIELIRTTENISCRTLHSKERLIHE